MSSSGNRSVLIDAIEAGVMARDGASVARIDAQLNLSTAGLESYFYSGWRPELYDLLVVAAAIEFSDVVKRRPIHGWARQFSVRVAVHDPSLWQRPNVAKSLTDAVGLLTGDQWSFEFVARNKAAVPVRQCTLPLPPNARTIIPYSDGLDSRAVAAMCNSQHPGTVVRVRLGSAGRDLSKSRQLAFNVVPYRVRLGRSRVETSARSRGFKFAAVTGIAACLAQIRSIVVTESGQGALGPALTASGQVYPDYRVHPRFMGRMERLIDALTGHRVQFEFPRLWHTKGETLSAASSLNSIDLTGTRSCWQSSRQVAIDGVRRQCGICAACLLRRMSMHAAGIQEDPRSYVWEDLAVSHIDAGTASSFEKVTPAMRQYAIAGALHLDHLAALATSTLHSEQVSRFARALARDMGLDAATTEGRLRSLLQRHRDEWREFVGSLGPHSFLRQIAAVLS